MTGVPSPHTGANEKLFSYALAALLHGSIGDVAIIVIDTHANIASWNEGANRLFGYAAEEMIGRTVDTVQLWHRPKRTLLEVSQQPDPPAGSELECLGEHRDGAKFWAATILSPITDPYGSRVGTAIVVRDTTKAVEQNEKRQLELRLSTATIDSLPGIFYMYDDQGRFLRWNKEFELISGYTAEEIQRAHPLDFFLEADRALLRDKIESVFECGFDEVEANFVSKDGSVRPYYFNGVRFEVDGQTRLMGVGFDITRRRVAEAKLSDSEKRLRLALAAAHLGIFDWDLVTNQITWSRRHEELWGFAPGEFIGTYESFASRVHPDDLPIVNAEVERCKAAHDIYACEYRTVWPDGSIHWISGSGEFEYDEVGVPLRMRGAVMEVTARKLLEQKYLHAQKMESIGQLAGGVAHDFNNLLTVITGHCELAMMERSLHSETRAALVEISDVAERAATLTRQLLAFSRKSTANLVVVDINDIIRSSELLLRRLVGEEITLSTTLSAKISKVRVDPDHIGQLLMNLAVNARDAIGRVGNIDIQTKNVEIPEPIHRLAGLREGRYVQLDFNDNGSGIPPEHIDRIFEPFFTTKDVGKGTGLGLSVVYGIVEQSGGHIQVTSEVGATTFRIFFPAVE